jgi:hypothetical protein
LSWLGSATGYSEPDDPDRIDPVADPVRPANGNRITSGRYWSNHQPMATGSHPVVIGPTTNQWQPDHRG